MRLTCESTQLLTYLEKNRLRSTETKKISLTRPGLIITRSDRRSMPSRNGSASGSTRRARKRDDTLTDETAARARNVKSSIYYNDSITSVLYRCRHYCYLYTSRHYCHCYYIYVYIYRYVLLLL